MEASKALPEVAETLLLAGFQGECFEVEQVIRQVVHPQGIRGWMEPLPSTLRRLPHPPVGVRLQATADLELPPHSFNHFKA